MSRGHAARLLGCRRRSIVTGAARQWLKPGPLRPELLAPYSAEEVIGWRVTGAAKNGRISHAGMAEPVAAT